MFRNTASLLYLFLMLLSDVVSADVPLSIFVSIAPQQYLVERIGQAHVDVQVMLKPGDSPETFDPSPTQISNLTNAQLYFSIGVPFEKKWIEILKQSNSYQKIIDCCDQISLTGSSELDNHIWMNPNHAVQLASIIKEQLALVDPANEADYEQNFQELIAEMKLLDTEIKTILSKRRTDYFIISHASLGHYAKEYGLIQLSLEKHGKGLGARSLVSIIGIAKLENIKTVLVQKQHKTAMVSTFANEIGAKEIEIDPLAYDYVDTLRSISYVIAEATR